MLHIPSILSSSDFFPLSQIPLQISLFDLSHFNLELPIRFSRVSLSKSRNERMEYDRSGAVVELTSENIRFPVVDDLCSALSLTQFLFKGFLYMKTGNRRTFRMDTTWQRVRGSRLLDETFPFSSCIFSPSSSTLCST